jgi:hypothetical protein
MIPALLRATAEAASIILFISAIAVWAKIFGA